MIDEVVICMSVSVFAMESVGIFSLFTAQTASLADAWVTSP